MLCNKILLDITSVFGQKKKKTVQNKIIVIVHIVTLHEISRCNFPMLT